ncbi:hypothetical protein BBSC_1937 [Bifidobacterium scardovii JCM 12489 = DSM 13734]|nr:hypothetical protein BBSC_1937 [Bifidobacterium scardovii JCM 12489 = DSM 13734]
MQRFAGGTQPDHPRACGVNALSEVSAALSCGSSPRMRGKHAPAEQWDVFERIIPAHVG